MKKVFAIIFSSFLLIGGIASCESEYVDGYTLTINKKTVFTNRSPVHSTFKTKNGEELWLTYNNFSFSNDESDNCFAYLEKGGYLDFGSRISHKDINFKFSSQCTNVSFVCENETGILNIDEHGKEKISTNDVSIFGGHFMISLGEGSNVEKIGIVEIKISNFAFLDYRSEFEGFALDEFSSNEYTLRSYNNYLKHNTLYIPNSFNGKPINIIGSRVFDYGNNNHLIEEVFVPDSIIEFKNNSFSGLANLSVINIGNDSRLETIGESAFEVCSKLSSITIPQCVTSIGRYAFRYCGLLSYVIIPPSVTNIGVDAFPNLTNIFYFGDAEQYASSGLNIDPDVLYLYSATPPTQLGKYWHYFNGEPTIWG